MEYAWPFLIFGTTLGACLFLHKTIGDYVFFIVAIVVVVFPLYNPDFENYKKAASSSFCEGGVVEIYYQTSNSGVKEKMLHCATK